MERVSGACVNELSFFGQEWIIVEEEGKVIAPGVDCAKVAESGTGSYSNPECTTEEAGGKYVEIAGLTSTWLVNGAVPASATETLSVGVGVLTLEDMGVPAGVECTGADVTDVGTVGPGHEDTTTSVTFTAPATNCKPTAKAENLSKEEKTNACESVKNVEALDLPWLTELAKGENAAKESVFLDRLSGDGKGEPAYLTECKTALGTVDDTCTEVSAGSTVEVKNETSDVNTVFPKTLANEKTESAKCTIGGAENGLVKGESLIEVMGGTLAASQSE